MRKLFYFTLLSIISFNSLQGQCSIRDMVVDFSACSEEETFSAIINFLHSETNDSFDLAGNGITYGRYAYTALPLTLDGLVGDCETMYEFVARDAVNNECAKNIAAGSMCCGELECTIEIIDIDLNGCDNNAIQMVLDIEVNGTEEAGFDVFSGSEFVGYYEYSEEPVTINNFPSSRTTVETLIICNNDDAACCDTLLFETPCGCNLRDLSATLVDCNDELGEFYAILDLTAQMTADSFILGGNTTTYGTFAYADLPITIGPLPFSENIFYEFLFLDRASSFCFEAVDLGVITECPIIECEIFDVVSEAGECMDNNTFMVDVAFSYTEGVSDSFSIRGNGNLYGIFAYGEEFYRIGPVEGTCDGPFEFIVIDQASEDCRSFTELEAPVCCGLPCPLDAIRAEFNCVTNDLYLNISTNDSGDADTVYIYLNGELTYRLSYSETEYVTDIPDGLEYPLEIKAVDPINPSCVVSSVIDAPCGDCAIADLEVLFIECNGEDQLFFSIDFDTNFPDTIAFSIVYGENLSGFFSYGELPVTIGPLDNREGALTFTVKDSLLQDCVLSTEIEPVICESANEDLLPENVTYNIVRSQLSIHDPSGEIFQVSLSALNGQRLWKEGINQIFQKNLSNIPTGIYLLSFQLNRGIVTKKLFIP